MPNFAPHRLLDQAGSSPGDEAGPSPGGPRTYARRGAIRLLVGQLTAALVACQAGFAAARGEGGAGYRIIVHPDHPQSDYDRRLISHAFLKKVTSWPHGRAIYAVDLPSASAIRHRFTEGVLDRSVAAVRSYWQQLIFSGRAVPPPELDSESAVVTYVLKVPGAIGYVSDVTDVRNAKVLLLR